MLAKDYQKQSLGTTIAKHFGEDMDVHLTPKWSRTGCSMFSHNAFSFTYHFNEFDYCSIESPI